VRQARPLTCHSSIDFVSQNKDASTSKAPRKPRKSESEKADAKVRPALHRVLL
jgi:hypothetical protein